MNNVTSESAVPRSCVSTNRIHFKITLRISVKFGCGFRHQNTLDNYVRYWITLHEDRMEDFIRFVKSGLFYRNLYLYCYKTYICSRSTTVHRNALGCVECVMIVESKSYLAPCSISAVYFCLCYSIPSSSSSSSSRYRGVVATCWSVPVSHIQQSLQWSPLVSSALWCLVFYYSV